MTAKNNSFFKFSFLISSPTVFILVLNLCVYAFLGTQGISLISPKVLDLLNWGGNLSALTLTGDYWRLLTSMFLHGGALHLFLNMYMLFQIGLLSEFSWGKFRFILIYLLTGLFASLASAYWYGREILDLQQPIVSIGASGALMGVASSCLVYNYIKSIQSKETDTTEPFLTDWKPLAQVVFLNIGMGFFIPGVDNACHIGGSIAGVLLGLALLFPKKSAAHLAHTFAIVLFSCVIFIILMQKISNSEELRMVGSQLRSEMQTLQEESEFEQRKQAREIIAIEEKRQIPPSVNLHEAAGKTVILEGGAQDFILSTAGDKIFISNIEENSISLFDISQFKIVLNFKGPPFPKQNQTSSCPDNLCLGRGAAGIAPSANEKWALVSSIKDDEVSFMNLSNGELSWSVKVGRFPRNVFLSPDEKFGFVMNSADNSISVIDVLQKSVLKTMALGKYDATGFTNGRPLGLARMGDQLYIGDSVNNQILMLKMDSTTELKIEKNLGDFSPTQIAIDEKQKLLYVLGNQDFASRIKIFELGSFKLVDQFISCTQTRISAIALSPNGQMLVAHTESANKTAVLSTKTFRTIRSVSSTADSNLFEFSKDNKYLWALSRQGWHTPLTVYDLDKTLDVEKELQENGEVFCDLVEK